jgi:hypothetical protein
MDPRGDGTTVTMDGSGQESGFESSHRDGLHVSEDGARRAMARDFCQMAAGPVEEADIGDQAANEGSAGKQGSR